MPKVIIGICTYQRPIMLGKCLDSIFAQKIPAGWQFEILIVDNDAGSTLMETLLPNIARSPMKIHYAIERQRGIPYARNTACRESLKYGADWLLFLDDDEEAEPGWLEAYANAQQAVAAEAYTGSVRFLMPTGSKEPIHLTLGDKEDLTSLKRAATNNVMFSAKLLLPPWSMKFDTGMAFTGGSDLDFFTRVTDRGGKILFVKDAVVSEVVLESRLQLGWRLRRQYRVSANKVYMKFKRYGILKTWISALRELIMRFIEGALLLMALPFLRLLSKEKFDEALLRALISFAKISGIVIGLIGYHPQPYKTIDGY
ncbi:MAG TPA: glycosyltransferase family 2 protein [Methylophilaceae bacterium]|nr:glycosyltransferase family 2 protein [Methylophilaceae bacterium]